LNEKGFNFPLPYHFKNYVTGLFQHFDMMFLYYKSSIICE
jgi:hypothetical protein